MPVAELKGLRYSYPAWSDRPRPALRGIDLVLAPGLTLVAGESGAGKSTLLRVLNGLVPHFHGGTVSGRARVCGHDVLSTPTRELARHVGFVFQEPEVGFVRGTVEREVAFGPENHGLEPRLIRARVGEALDRTGVAHLSSRRLRTLSGGERQRVALAAALATASEMMVMDEPLSQLDEHAAAALVATLSELAASGRAVVVAEHRLEHADVADSTIAVVDGAAQEVSLSDEPGPWDPPVPTAACERGREAWRLQRVTVAAGTTPLLEGVDLAGHEGEVVVVTGANGTGKTTLLRTLAGLAAPLSGAVDRRPGRIAYLPQEPGVLLHRRSVRAEITQTLRWTQSPGTGDDVLELLGLGDLADRDPRDLSVGQRQRAALAAVLVGRPAIALLDEPTRGMDDAARRSLAAALHRLAAEGASVVLATHDGQLARQLGGRVVRIEDGGVRPELLGLPA